MIKAIVLTLCLLIFPVFAGDSSINFAPGINPQDLVKIHPKLKQIVAFIAAYCKENNIKFVITSAIRSPERNTEVHAVSMTHVEGRAVDFSIREELGWNANLIQDLFRKVIRNYGEYGAYSLTGGKQIVIFSHNNGNGFHTHLQVRKGLPWNN